MLRELLRWQLSSGVRNSHVKELWTVLGRSLMSWWCKSSVSPVIHIVRWLLSVSNASCFLLILMTISRKRPRAEYPSEYWALAGIFDRRTCDKCDVSDDHEGLLSCLHHQRIIRKYWATHCVSFWSKSASKSQQEERMMIKLHCSVINNKHLVSNRA